MVDIRHLQDRHGARYYWRKVSLTVPLRPEERQVFEPPLHATHHLDRSHIIYHRIAYRHRSDNGNRPRLTRGNYACFHSMVEVGSTGRYMSFGVCKVIERGLPTNQRFRGINSDIQVILEVHEVNSFHRGPLRTKGCHLIPADSVSVGPVLSSKSFITPSRWLCI